MALVKCKECGKEISNDAEVCPHCGKKVVSLGEALEALINFIKCVTVLFIIAFIFFSIKCDNDEVKSHQTAAQKVESHQTVAQNEYDKTKSNNILEKLHKKIPQIIMKKNIEDIKIEAKEDKKDYNVFIYLKDGYDIPPDIQAKAIVKNILDILIDEGHNPYKEHTDISVTVVQRIKGVTEQDLVEAFGQAMYNYNNDTIQWYDWNPNI